MIKPKKQFNTIDEYIRMYPKNVQTILKKLKHTIHESAPLAEEVISYNIPAFKFHGILVYFAAFEHHIGFYPTSSPLRVFKKELAKYEGGKGTIRFPIDKPIPFDLVKRIVKFRVKENLMRSM